MPTRNAQLFYRIAKVIEDSPDTYNQRVYGAPAACGTAHCIAGFAAALNGWEPHRGSECWASIHRGDGVEFSCWEVGQEILGLEEWEADTLFEADWIPGEGMTVPEALRAIAEGADIESMSQSWAECVDCDESYPEDELECGLCLHCR